MLYFYAEPFVFVSTQEITQKNNHTWFLCHHWGCFMVGIFKEMEEKKFWEGNICERWVGFWWSVYPGVWSMSEVLIF